LPSSRVLADVRLPGSFDSAYGITYSQLSLDSVSAPGTISGFGSVPVSRDVMTITGSSFQLVAFTAKVSRLLLRQRSRADRLLDRRCLPQRELDPGVGTVLSLGIGLAGLALPRRG
jgi:hypothetical protein